MHIKISRRSFIKGTALVSSLAVAPEFLTRTAEGFAGRIDGFDDDRILVVVQLGGGNDGLNMVVPHGDDAYYRARPRLGVAKKDVLRLTDEIGLNGSMTDLMRLYDDGKLAVVQGVGYPNPDRSHFRSMEIWQTASDSNEYLGSGWIGRYFDNYCDGAARPQAGVAIGSERPQSFNGVKGYGVAFEDPHAYGWRPGTGTDTPEVFARLNAQAPSENETLDFLRHTTSNALRSSAEVRAAAEAAGHAFEMRRDALQTVAGLIRGGLDTRIYYVSTSGFDTHANQRGTHDDLLNRVGEALTRFQAQLEKDGNAGRVVTMVFSEFGRRVEENASGGTDHGTAAPMFLVGNRIKAGIHGVRPSLTDLDQGDLKHTVDFRSIYASVLNQWFDIKPETILGQTFSALPVIV